MSIKFKGGYSRMTGCNMGNHPEYDRGFCNGQQSKQEEVNKLQVQIDELQNQIEGALDHAVNPGGYDDLTHIINILKGE